MKRLLSLLSVLLLLSQGCAQEVNVASVEKYARFKDVLTCGDEEGSLVTLSSESDEKVICMSSTDFKREIKGIGKVPAFWGLPHPHKNFYLEEGYDVETFIAFVSSPNVQVTWWLSPVEGIPGKKIGYFRIGFINSGKIRYIEGYSFFKVVLIQS